MARSQRPTRDLDDVDAFTVTVKKGEFVFREGSAGDEMFIIQEGEIEVLKQYGSETRRLASLEVGDFFGEMSLLHEMPRDGSARATTDCKLLRFDAAALDQIIRENPEIAIRMLRKLSGRLREREEADAKAERIAMGVLGPLQPKGTERPSSSPPARPDATRPALLVHESSGKEFALGSKSELVVGRNDRATGFTPDVDFSELDTERTLSRRHAKILRSENGYYVREDRATGNGTYVNSKRIPTATAMKLEDGDRVRFGLVRTIFKYR
jgi:hypothetical protein